MNLACCALREARSEALTEPLSSSKNGANPDFSDSATVLAVSFHFCMPELLHAKHRMSTTIDKLNGKTHSRFLMSSVSCGVPSCPACKGSKDYQAVPR
jgi:hypothetical protein